MAPKITSNLMSEGTDKLIADKSINEAKWLLGTVAVLATIVFATGVAAAALGG
ncbi:MAG: hypothetical protein AAGA53_02650 [Pseudomonadota bacterium]